MKEIATYKFFKEKKKKSRCTWEKDKYLFRYLSVTRWMVIVTYLINYNLWKIKSKTALNTHQTFIVG